jgi:predicted glycoside hydrolase/deacetylase ChbG (UPF0249 family)
MLIINADDFGKNMVTTDNIIMCFKENRITSTSAMVFMRDSERAANLCLENGVDVGLHLNFDDEFSGNTSGRLLREYHRRVGNFLTGSKYSQIIYNPLLRKEFEYLYEAQYEEFMRLYRRSPSHINGHHHMHLCVNVLVGNIIPKGEKVRRSFTFVRGERPFANRLYRRGVDAVVKRRYITTDMFFAAVPSEEPDSLKQKVALAEKCNVELMVHVFSQMELEYLMRQDFVDTIRRVSRGTYRDLPGKPVSNETGQARVSTHL